MPSTRSSSVPFTAILSTAGSRKTTQLTQQAVAHVVAGRSRPEDLLLTTLTRSAAAQLHERMVEQFLRAGRGFHGTASTFLNQCHRLEHAAIGTLHALGLETLKRTAILCGMPTSVGVFSAAAERDAMLDAFSSLPAERLSEFWPLARRLGRHEPGLRTSSGIAAIDDLLDTIAVFRRLQIHDKTERCQRWLETTQQLIDKLPQTAFATESFADVLQTVSDEKGKGVPKEVADKLLSRRFWGGLTQLTKKKGVADLGLQSWGSGFDTSKLFHDDCIDYAKALAELAHDVLEVYAERKQRDGVVDYHDQAAALQAGGWERPAGFIGCDEVQDLTPLQIQSLLTIIDTNTHRDAAIAWVGDECQQLFGYQGASWKKALSVLKQRAASFSSVHTNYRSSPLLVRLFNKLFSAGSGSRFPEQTAGRDLRTNEVSSVERWELPEANADDTLSQARAIASGVAHLLDRRPELQPSDIAVLVRTNWYADQVIIALNERGLSVDASPQCLAGTREGSLVIESLRWLADPSDTLAAAEIWHLWQDWSPQHDPTAWFWEMLRTDSGLPDAWPIPALAKLVNDREGASRLSPVEAVERVIAALQLTERLASWEGTAGRLRNLDAILSVARGYERRAAAERRPATIAGLAAFFDDDAQQQETPTHVRAATGGITVTTTHSAKGGGWPVAIVAQCEWQPRSGDSTFLIREYDRVDPETAAIQQVPHVLPWPMGSYPFPGTDGVYRRNPFLPPGAKLANLLAGRYGEAAASLEGSQVIRAADQEAEENNVFVACTRAESILVIACPSSDNKRLAFLQPAFNALLPRSAEVNSPKEIPEVSEPGSLDYTFHRYEGKPPSATSPQPAAVVSAASVAATIANFKAAQHSNPYPLEYPPGDGKLPPPDGTYPMRFWKPSDEPATHTRGLDPAACSTASLGLEALPAEDAVRITAANDTRVGDVIHTLYAAIPSLAAVSPGDRRAFIETIATRCIAAGGHDLPLAAADLGNRLLAFERWLEEGGLSLTTELPLSVTRTAFPLTFWRGRLDALAAPDPAVPPGGPLWVIDHKSATRVSLEWLAAWIAETTAYASCLPAETTATRILIHAPLAAELRETAFPGRRSHPPGPTSD